MSCKSCESNHQSLFSGEVAVRFPGLHNLDRLAALLFPELLVCLDCGFTEFVIADSDLRLLAQDAPVALGVGREGDA